VKVPWRLLKALLLLILAAVGLGAYLAYAPFGDGGPHPFNQDRNAVYLEHKWLEKPQTPADMERLFKRLRDHGVLYAFPHLIPFTGAGGLPVHDREQMRAFLATARQTAPGLKILPWIGGLRVGYRRSKVGAVDLMDLGQRQRIVAECRGLMDEGFDGVHVNVEPVNNGNVEFLALLRALRTAVGPDRTLSVSAIRPGPVAVSVAPNFFWTREYYARVAALADQVVVMSYDTAIPTAPLYRRYVSWVSSALTQKLSDGSTARVLVGVPTYDDTNLMHRAGVETLENGLLGVVAGLRGVGGGGTFEGVAVYAEWTTDEAEWQTFDRVWRGRSTTR
jgi:hypothetical protein